MSFRLSVGKNVLNPREARRLVKRDPQLGIDRVVAEIKTQAQLDAFLFKLPEHMRQGAYDLLAPRMKFEARFPTSLVEL